MCLGLLSIPPPVVRPLATLGACEEECPLFHAPRKMSLGHLTGLERGVDHISSWISFPTTWPFTALASYRLGLTWLPRVEG